MTARLASDSARVDPAEGPVSTRAASPQVEPTGRTPLAILVIDDGSGIGDFVDSTGLGRDLVVTGQSSLGEAADSSANFDVVILCSSEAKSFEDPRAHELWPKAIIVCEPGPTHAREQCAGAPRAAATVVEKALTHRRLERKMLGLSRRAIDAGVGGMVGESPAMNRLFDWIELLGESAATVLVSGGRGSGKRLAARAVHDSSDRRDGPFVSLQCGAIPPSLLETELFGESGARDRDGSSPAGAFMRADGGTLVLNEVGDLPLDVQWSLFTVLEERRLPARGSEVALPFDVRVIATTNRDLKLEVELGRFREDLYYRLHVVDLEVPGLRARGEDVLLLAQHFLNAARTRHGRQPMRIRSDSAAYLLEYDWPGNVRELEHCIEHAVSVARHDEIVLPDLPQAVRQFRADRDLFEARDPRDLLSLDELERRYAAFVSSLVRGDKLRVARILGIDARTLADKLERLP